MIIEKFYNFFKERIIATLFIRFQNSAAQIFFITILCLITS